MKKYKHVFFDLDHTLWDFEKNSHETLEHLYYHYRLTDFGVKEPDAFIAVYSKINNRMWELYNRGEIDKATLREKRFTDAFIELGVPAENVPAGIWQLYLELCPTKTNLFPHAIEVLEYLHGQYSISIITNGFEETQYRKIRHSGIEPYISHILTSEKAGYQKPDPRIFLNLLQLNSANAPETIMVGDNLETDIAGARAAGIAPVFFNPGKTKYQHNAEHEIYSLLQLNELL